MAANAFVLFQIYLHHAEIVSQGKVDKGTAVTTAAIAIGALLGMAASYLGLGMKPKDKGADWAEIGGVVPIGLMAIMYITGLLKTLFF
jgi:hypothetical protein